MDKENKEDAQVTMLEFTPYRGTYEPVDDVQMASIKMFPEHLEVLVAYDYRIIAGKDESGENIMLSDICRMRCILPREGLGLAETVVFHQNDIERKEALHLVTLEGGGRRDLLIRTDKKNSARIYKAVRNWILVK